MRASSRSRQGAPLSLALVCALSACDSNVSTPSSAFTMMPVPS